MKYLKYLWQAKGRHGTHSPFIYNLVENALHSKANTIDLFDSMEDKSSIKRVNTIWRVANFLKVGQGYIDEKAIVSYPFLNQFLGFSDSTLHLNSQNRLCIITTAQELEDVVSKHSLPFENEVAILVLHFSNLRSETMERYYETETFNLTVLTWDFSILMYNKDFKQKQHFVLR